MTTSRRRRFFATTATMALAAGLVVPVTAFVAQTPAFAQEDLKYGTTVESAAFEGYGQVPSEVRIGSPSTMILLEDPGKAPLCESIAGIYDMGLLLGEYAETILAGKYKNDTRMRALNPPDSRPTKAEFSTFPGGPHVLAECPTTTSGSGDSTWGGYVSDQFSFESATSHSESGRLADVDAVAGETLTKFHGITMADSSIRTFESWMKVEWRPEKDALVSYRVTINGVSNGTQEMASSGGQGIVLSGQNVAGADFTKQFNEQSKAHEKALAALGTYGFRILEPRYYEDPILRRPTVEAPVLDANWGFTAREGGIGHRQGLRIGVSRVSGRISIG